MDPVMKLFGIDISAPAGDPVTWQELIADCACCVGPLRDPLRQAGVTEPALHELSDTACTAALLTRLWRDVRVDVFNHDRVYLPRDIATRHGLDLPLMVKAVKLDSDRGCEGDQGAGSCDCASMPRSGMLAVSKPYCATVRELVKRTDRMFLESRSLWPSLPPELRGAYRRMTYEGRAMLGTIAGQGYDTLTRRPNLRGLRRVWVGARMFLPR